MFSLIRYAHVGQLGFKCIGCGACESICPKKCIRVEEVGRTGLRALVVTSSCIQCGKCLKVCPVFDLPIPEDLSSVLEVFRGYSSNGEIYKNSASGGVISSILYDLFSAGEIDGALVTFFDSKLNLFGDFISSKEEITKHSGSFYHSCKQLLGIKNIQNFQSVAIVGLPCHIIAARKFVSEFGREKSVALFISLFCSIGRMKKGFEEFLLAHKGVKLDELEVNSYRGRYGEQRPGAILLSTNQGILSLDCMEYLSFGDYFYIPDGCYTCRRLYGTCADISVGDDWGIVTSKKVALVCVHSRRGLQALRKNNLLVLQQLSKNERIPALIKSQPMGYPRKFGRGNGIHLALRVVKALGKFNTSRHKILRKAAFGARSLVSRYICWLHRRRLRFLKISNR